MFIAQKRRWIGESKLLERKEERKKKKKKIVSGLLWILQNDKVLKQAIHVLDNATKRLFPALCMENTSLWGSKLAPILCS